MGHHSPDGIGTRKFPIMLAGSDNRPGAWSLLPFDTDNSPPRQEGPKASQAPASPCLEPIEKGKYDGTKASLGMRRAERRLSGLSKLPPRVLYIQQVPHRISGRGQEPCEMHHSFYRHVRRSSRSPTAIYAGPLGHNQGRMPNSQAPASMR